MRSRVALAAFAALVGAAVIVVIVMVVAPGDDSETSRGDFVRTQPAPPTAPPAPPPQPQGDAVAGREVFASAGCGNCHTLAAAGSTGTIGPELDARTPNYVRFLEQVRFGGGGMPAYEGILTDDEIEDVVTFVLESSGR